MPCNVFTSESYDLFALGILDDFEADEMRAHMRANCVDCASNLRESMERVTQIALTTIAVEPRKAMRGQIISLVKPPAPVRLNWLRFGLAGAAVAMFALAVGIGLGWLGSSRIQSAGSPTIVSRLSPPPVPNVQPRAIAPPPSPSKQTPREVVVVQAPSPGLAAERSQIASLEITIRARDEQLAAAQQQLSRLQAAAAAAPAEPPNHDVAGYESRIERLTEQLELYKTALERQRRELTANVQLISLLSVPDVKLVNLTATEQGGGASARALVSGRSAVFLASRLPDLQPGRSYQLWLMRRSSPAIVSGGVFRPNPSGGATFEIKDAAALSGLTAMAVTEEPAGGSPLPTGHKILVGLAKS